MEVLLMQVADGLIPMLDEVFDEVFDERLENISESSALQTRAVSQCEGSMLKSRTVPMLRTL